MNISIFIVVFLIIFGIYFYNKSNTDRPKVGLSIDMSQVAKLPSLSCGVLDPSTIVNCTNNDQCGKCICSSDSNLTGCMTCQGVNATNRYYSDISFENCKAPYAWTGPIPPLSGGMCILQNGSYCLPTEIVDVQCNPYTSKKILRQTTSGYQWGCICNDPTQFNQIPNKFGDCNQVQICGMLGSSQNPDPVTKRGIYRKGYTCSGPDGSNSCYDPGDLCYGGKCFWQAGSTNVTGSSWDPRIQSITSGVSTKSLCKCGPNEIANQTGLTCMPNICVGGEPVPGTNDRCICPAGTVDCRSIAFSDNSLTSTKYYNGICTMPSCVPDPCGPNGFYDTNTGNCVCNDGYTVVNNSYNVIGQSCVKTCSDERNPCGSRNNQRGDCYFDNTPPDTYSITIGQNTTGITDTTTISKGGIYLQVDRNGKLFAGSRPSSIGPEMFSLIPYCDPTIQPQGYSCPLKAYKMSLNDMFYVKYGSSYIDFYNKRTVNNAPSMGPISTMPSDGSSFPTLISLKNLTASSSSGNYRDVTTISTQIYFPAFSQYLWCDKFNNLSMKPSNNTEKCWARKSRGLGPYDPNTCNTGWAQDPTGLCKTPGSCTASYGAGEYCGSFLGIPKLCCRPATNNCNGLEPNPVWDYGGGHCTCSCG